MRLSEHLLLFDAWLAPSLELLASYLLDVACDGSLLKTISSEFRVKETVTLVYALVFFLFREQSNMFLNS